MSKPSKPPRPSHFLSFPIQDPSVQLRAQEAISILLDALPRPDGIDESLAVDPRSLHLTLGIMPLVGRKAAEKGRSRDDEQQSPKAQQGVKSVDDAAKLLRDCEGALQDLLKARQTSEISVSFDRLETFQSEPSKCRVLYVEPAKDTEGTNILHELADHLRERFHDAGMLADYKQPLTLHCTLMKSSARAKKPMPQATEPQSNTSIDGSRTEEAARDAAIIVSSELHEVTELEINDQTASLQPQQGKKKRSRPKSRFAKSTPFDASLVLSGDKAPFALGVSSVSTVQLCQMGRRDETGRYVALEEIQLFSSNAG